MAQRTFSFASLVAGHATSRRERATKRSRSIKQAFRSAFAHQLEDRLLLTLSSIDNQAESLNLSTPACMQSHSQNAAVFPMATATASQESAQSSNDSTSQQTLDDLDPLARYAISSSIGADQPVYAASQNAEGDYTFQHGYSVQMNASGATFQTDSDTWRFSPVSYGYGSNQRAIGASTIVAANNKVTYDATGIDTWFVNGPLGVQQGFTVESRPDTGNLSDPLMVNVRLGGSLIAGVQADGDGLTLARADGSTALNYTGLLAYDATGRTLDAHLEMSPSSSGQNLRFVVNDQNAVYPLTIDPYTESAKLTASGAVGYGLDVSLSTDGSTALVGAYGNNSFQGAAYLYTKPAGGWATTSSFTAKLTTSDGTAEERFGSAVSLSGDGSAALVGAYYQNTGRGAAYVYTKPVGGWATTSSFTAKLTASDGAGNDRFGSAVSLSTDGSTALVGAVYANSYQGAAYLFTRPVQGWTTSSSFTAKLSDSNGAGNANYGVSVSLSSDGSTALVGASGKKNYQGAVFLYTKPGGAGQRLRVPPPSSRLQTARTMISLAQP